MADEEEVTVPDVVGLTKPAAETELRRAGLVVGRETTVYSAMVPALGVAEMKPPPSSKAKRGTAVDLELSLGQKTSFWESALANLPTILVCLLGVLLLVVVLLVLTDREGAFLIRLADKEFARGLITFLFTVTTVGIALILAVATLLSTSSPDDDKRFDRGKQVLTVLIGVLGTIVGFYFGADTKGSQQAARPLTITTVELPDGTVNKAYVPTILKANGGTPPLKWSATSLPAGLTLDSASGTISGTPTAQVPKTKVTVTVTDSATPPVTAQADHTIEVK